MTNPLSRRTLFQYAIASGVTAATTPLASRLAWGATKKASPAPAQIGFFGAGFVPMVAHVVAGTELQFANDSSQTLQLASATGRTGPGQAAVGGQRPQHAEIHQTGRLSALR